MEAGDARRAIGSACARANYSLTPRGYRRGLEKSTAMTSILLAEDDEDVRLLVEDVLLDAGYQVDTAGTVACALSRLDAQGYDLLLTDGRLPDGTGLMIADKANLSGTKVLLFTGYVHEFPPEELARYTVVTKPADMDYLVERVAQAISA